MSGSDSGAPRAAVVGAGVIGLTCADALQDAGFAVDVVAAAPPVATTSAVAGGLWLPYRAFPQDRVAAWAERSRVRFEALRSEAVDAGVGETEFLALLPDGDGSPWWAADLPAGRVRPADPRDLPPGYGAGVLARVPLLETPRYLRWLERRVRDRGGGLEQRRVASLDDVEADVVVNCAGVEAGRLASDPTVSPARGQVVHVRPRRPVRAVVDDDGPNAVAYVLPRPDVVVCGGTVEPGDWDTAARPATTADILRRCLAIEPALAGCEVLGAAAGLRPDRPAVRLERDPAPGARGAIVIHCYGHGGAGFTLSWGCAEEVAALAREAIDARAG